MLPVAMISVWVGFLSDIQIFDVKIFQLVVQVGVVLRLSLRLFLISSALATVETTIIFRCCPSDECFLAFINLTRPPHPQVDDQFAFMDLAFTCMTFHECIFYTGPCTGQVGLFLLLILFLVSLSEDFIVWFDHLLLVNKAYWWLAPVFLDFLFGCVASPFSWNI